MYDPSAHRNVMQQATGTVDATTGIYYGSSQQTGPNTLRAITQVWTAATPTVAGASAVATIGSGSLTYGKLRAYLAITTGIGIQVVAAKLQVSPDNVTWYDFTQDNSGTLGLIICTTVGGSAYAVARDYTLSFAPLYARLVGTTVTALTGTVNGFIEVGG